MKKSLVCPSVILYRAGYVLILVALLLPLLIGLVGLTVDGGLLLASHERAQNVADATARSVASALKNGASHNSLQAWAETVAFGLNALPRDSEPVGGRQVVVHHPPISGPFTDDPAFVEVLISHPLDTRFIHVLSRRATHHSLQARAVAGFRSLPVGAGVVILNPTGNPGLSVSGTNSRLMVDAAVVVFTNRQGENEFGAIVGQIPAGQPSIVMGGSGSTLLASSVYVSGGVDDDANYVAPAVGELHAGTNDVVNDPYHDSSVPLPIPTTANGVINRQLGSVSVTVGAPANLVVPNSYNSSTGVTTLNPGIYSNITINGGNVVFLPGIYVLQNKSGEGNIMTITGGTVTANGVMFYNTGSTWDPVTGGDDQADPAISSQTAPNGQRTKFAGITLNGPNVNMTPIHVAADSPMFVFQDMVLYQRRINTESLNINNGASYPGGISGRIYSKWGSLNVSGNGTYNFSIVVGSMSSSGNAAITVRDRLPLTSRIRPVRLVE
ncbi:MAG: pilus assembly protein TadG-related protein [Planctomycetota bacterium]